MYTAGDIEKVLAMVESPANGLCFGTGSLSVRADNDLPAIVRRFAPRINAVHFRRTQRLPGGLPLRGRPPSRLGQQARGDAGVAG